MKKTLALISAISVLWAMPALALDLASARASGAVGESLSGYVVAIQPSKDIGALVADVNAKRKEEYSRISKQNGQPVDVVAKLAAQQVVGNLPKGAKYQGSDGNWKTR